MSTLLEVSGVSVSFDGFKAINNLSFQIGAAELRAIIGPNGAGKTSMLNCINGFYHPQEGLIEFRGKARKRMMSTRKEKLRARDAYDYARAKAKQACG